jgi:hypothetical protein
MLISQKKLEAAFTAQYKKWNNVELEGAQIEGTKELYELQYINKSAKEMSYRVAVSRGTIYAVEMYTFTCQLVYG